jgi:hypothetical protein
MQSAGTGFARLADRSNLLRSGDAKKLTLGYTSALHWGEIVNQFFHVTAYSAERPKSHTAKKENP